MEALSQLFASTTLLLPCSTRRNPKGEIPLSGRNLVVKPLPYLSGRDLGRKVLFPFWLARTFPSLWREIRRADAVHAPVPGDISTIGMILALMLQKPLFVRHCGNWLLPRTLADHFWKWCMERFAGGKNVMVATGGAAEPPSKRNGHVEWIFATSMSELELAELGIPRTLTTRKGPRLIIACRQEANKGTDIVIRSLPELLQEFPHTVLDVLGDGASLTAFKQLAADLAVDAHVVFHGRVGHKQVLRHLQRADLLCYPTTSSEGFPKIVLEAMACGVPVISTPVSVLPLLIGAGQGVLLNEATPAEVVKAVRLCLGNRELYSRMSAAAVAKASQYSLEKWRDTIGGWLTAAWGPLCSHD
jgi:glycosyltransferase involved in cell wall biosynthesis